MPLRILLSLMKKPFQYSVVKKAHTQSEEEFMIKSLSDYRLGEHQFGIASGNICLLPEFLARYNNLSHSGQRARSIGERIVIDQFFYGGVPKSILGLPANGVKKNDVRSSRKEIQRFVGGLAAHFPRLDFLCLQEVFDWNYNKVLREELHKVFPYILHDVGVMSLSSNYFMINSGLMFASRHPVLNADFKFYKHSISQCVFTSKGLLTVKVLIGKDTDSKRQVGYIFSTHLQAYQGTQPVIARQLDDILEWSAEFRKQTADSRDVVLFDIICGDLNFDNLSPGDKLSRDHGIFDHYHDPCRVRPGEDQPWVVGTEFKQIFMHETTATSPDSLKASLADPVLRHRHLTDADIVEQTMDSLVHVKLRTDHHGNVVTFPEAGMRRIDYILSRKDTPVDITRFQFVTRLASLTDHIPVAMTFKAKV
ncbi:hypothetical protein V1264_000848 [Littorina saxatilis]